MDQGPDSAIVDNDKKILHQMGYAQELSRRMRTFQNFAVSFSIICIVSGGLNSFGQGIGSVGGAAIGIGWPLSCLFSLFFAIAMGQIGSAYPVAGGVYHWASILGGRFVGWVTAWFNLVGLLTVLAAINVGTYLYLIGSIAPYLAIDTASLTPVTPTAYSIAVQATVVGIITASQGLFNHLGIRLTSKLTDLSGYLIFASAIALTVTLLVCAKHIDLSRLWTFTNYSGDPGGGVWPKTGNRAYLFLLGFLLPAYTVTGFDASGHTAEETIDAARAIPRAMIHSVVWSGLFGWVMLSAVILAAPDMKAAASQGFRAFFWVMNVVPPAWRLILFVVIAVAQYLCGLATVTSASRMVFAFSRDGGLPGSKFLRRVSHQYRTPVTAIWAVALLSVAFTIYAPVYTTIAAVCVIFLYISYLLPIVAGLIAYRRNWTVMGPFDVGKMYPVFAILAIIGAGTLLFIGVQPPNQQALTVTLGVLGLTIIVWFAIERRRFQGPPMGDMIKRRLAEIAAAEVAVGEA
jgi:amino acid transporter